MAGINNKYDYRGRVLTALGVEHTPSDVRNEDEYRKKVLDGFGVEYTDDDINRKNLYREKIVNGLASGGGGGGDLSTAQVTITNNDEMSHGYYLPVLMSQGDIENCIFPTNSIAQGTTKTITAVLGKGGCAFMTSDGHIDSVSGNAQIMNPKIGTTALITGDCTITITA